MNNANEHAAMVGRLLSQNDVVNLVAADPGFRGHVLDEVLEASEGTTLWIDALHGDWSELYRLRSEATYLGPGPDQLLVIDNWTPASVDDQQRWHQALGLIYESGVAKILFTSDRPIWLTTGRSGIVPTPVLGAMACHNVIDEQPLVEGLIEEDAQFRLARELCAVGDLDRAIQTLEALEGWDDQAIAEFLGVSASLVSERRRNMRLVATGEIPANQLTNRWASLIRKLSEVEPRVSAGVKASGFELEGSLELEEWLAHQGKDGLQFLLELLRPSDIAAIFGRSGDSPLATRAANVLEAFEQNGTLPELPAEPEPRSGRPSRNDRTHPSPAGKLWEVLVVLQGAESVEYGLGEDERFRAMRGPVRARFVEWVYELREKRELAERVCALLRPYDAQQFAEEAGVSEEALGGLDWRLKVRAGLSEMGLTEPEPPRAVIDGVGELETLHGDLAADRTPDLTVGRRGTERMLKIILRFLWDAGFDDVLTEIAKRRLHGFKGCRANADGSWIFGLDLGAMSYLLRAFELAREERDLAVPFSEQDEFWSSDVHDAVVELGQTLNPEVHDKGVEKEERRKAQLDSLTTVLELLAEGHIPRPRAVSFFRRFDDGNAVHLEGYAYDRRGQPDLLRFYEVGPVAGDIEFHRPYLYMAATNPSAVDAAVTPLHEELRSPVE